MYTLLLLFILCGMCGVVAGANVDIIFGYAIYSCLIALAIILFIGVSALISVIAPKIEDTKICNVIELTDDIIVIDIGQGHSLSLSREHVTETIVCGEKCPKLKITMFHMDDTLAKWFIPICLSPDIWTLYI